MFITKVWVSWIWWRMQWIEAIPQYRNRHLTINICNSETSKRQTEGNFASIGPMMTDGIIQKKKIIITITHKLVFFIYFRIKSGNHRAFVHLFFKHYHYGIFSDVVTTYMFKKCNVLSKMIYNGKGSRRVLSLVLHI